MKLITFIPLLFISLPSYAEYINTFKDERHVVWLDTSSKQGTRNIRTINELINYRDKQIEKPGLEYYSIVYQYQFDCSKNVFKVLKSVAFEKWQGQGRAVFRDDTETPTYMGVKKDSSVYKALVYACK
jgi:hypothetical protein